MGAIDGLAAQIERRAQIDAVGPAGVHPPRDAEGADGEGAAAEGASVDASTDDAVGASDDAGDGEQD